MLRFIAIVMLFLVVSMPVSFAALLMEHTPSDVKDITDTSVTLNWKTPGSNSTSRVTYGLQGNQNGEILDSARVIDHAVTITGLSPETRYYYTLYSDSVSDSGKYPVFPQVASFQTLAEPDNSAPSFIESSVLMAGANEAQVKWVTNENSNSSVTYWDTPSNKKTVEKKGYVTQHIVEVEVTNSTLYYYTLKSCDLESNCAESEEKTFVAGLDYSSHGNNLDVSLPEMHNSNKIDVTGTTVPGAQIKIYVNGGLSRSLSARSDGSFNVYGLSLPSVANQVEIISTDQTNNVLTKTFEVKVDAVPPILAVDELPDLANTSSLLIKGNVNEQSKVIFKVSSKEDTIPPKVVTGFNNGDVYPNSVELYWDESPETDIEEYLIYRNGKRLTATSGDSFIDTALDSGKTYEYYVTAIDQSCNEGSPSSIVRVTTLAGGQSYNIVPAIHSVTCEDQEQSSLDVKGDFSYTISLGEGTNFVEIIARDAAGNEDNYVKTIKLDTTAPEFESTNLDSLSPTYIPDVTIKGKVSEKARVHAYLNGEGSPSFSTTTDAEGNFELDIKLKKKYVESLSDLDDSTSGFAEVEDAYPNQIVLVAEDVLGKTGRYEGEIYYALCGKGSWWDVQISEVTPSMLTPRLIADGNAQIGFSVELKWQGGSHGGQITSRPNVNIRSMSPATEDEWDTGWVTPTSVWSTNNTVGYVLLDVRAPYFSNTENLTMLAKENNISDHRIGECKAGGFGCVKIPLMLTIDFEQITKEQYVTMYADEDKEDYNVDDLVQKQCWEVEIAIDRRVPSDKIPEEFLNGAIGFLNVTIDMIDKVLPPLRTVQKVVFVACAATWLINFYLQFQESFACGFSSDLNVFSKVAGVATGSNFDRRIADIGMCEERYKSESDEKYSACNSCESAVMARVEFEKNMHLICDRIFCPAAPTFQTYVKNEKKQNERIETAENKQTVNVKGTLYPVGSSCALTTDGGYDLAIRAYQAYKDGDTKIEGTDKSCSDTLHPANADCCGYEYMYHWDTAALMMNELKDSTCLSAQNAGRLDNFKTDIPGETCDFSRLYNSAAGFCEPGGEPTAEMVISRRPMDIGDSSGASCFGVTKNDIEGKEDRYLYFRIIPPDIENSGGSGGNYIVQSGYVDKITEVGTIPEKVDPTKPHKVNQNIKFVPSTDSGENLADEYFFQPSYFETDEAQGKTFDELSEIKKQKFITKMSSECGAKNNQAEELYKEIQSKIGISDQEYIIEPTSGILRSIQAVCLPGLVSYLNFYDTMLRAVRSCLQTILITGDGSPGVCQAVLSAYVCDLIWDILRCFQKKYNSGLQRNTEGGFGSFFGALTEAGTNTRRSIQGRYGTSNIWQTMFAEKKLVHAVCLWAFTGTWDVDIEGMLETDFPVNIESQGFLYPCTRRFVAFNPVSSPMSGLTNWNYHVGLGIVAGSDLKYDLKLVCSQGYECDAAEGFENGRCDCPKGEMSYHLRGGTLSAGDTVQSEGDIYESIPNSGVRYDKAVLTYEYKDNKQDTQKKEIVCDINQVGGKAPASCSFDAGTLSYRCGIDFGKEDWIKFLSVEPNKEDDPYMLNDKLKFDVHVLQQYPEDSVTTSRVNNEFTKYLDAKVYNHNNVLVWDISRDGAGPYAFNTDGDDYYTVDAGVLKKSDFEKSYSADGNEGCKISSEWGTNTISKDDIKCNEVRPIMVRYTNDGKFDWVYATKKGSNYEKNNDDWKPCDIDGRDVLCSNVKFTLATDKMPDSAKTKSVAIYYNDGGKTFSGCNSGEVQKWYAEFTLYRSAPSTEDTLSEGYNFGSNVATDNLGRQQRKKVTFDVRCSDTKTTEVDEECPLSIDLSAKVSTSTEGFRKQFSESIAKGSMLDLQMDVTTHKNKKDSNSRDIIVKNGEIDIPSATISGLGTHLQGLDAGNCITVRYNSQMRLDDSTIKSPNPNNSPQEITAYVKDATSQFKASNTLTPTVS